MTDADLATRVATLESRVDQLRRLLTTVMHIAGAEVRHHSHVGAGPGRSMVTVHEADVQAVPLPDLAPWWDEEEGE